MVIEKDAVSKIYTANESAVACDSDAFHSAGNEPISSSGPATGDGPEIGTIAGKHAMRRLPSRMAPVLFGLVLTFLMTSIVSLIATVLAIGFVPGMPARWLGSWMTSWAVAFPAILVFGPVVRRLVSRLVEPAVPDRL
jgi:hypothetical protein